MLLIVLKYLFWQTFLAAFIHQLQTQLHIQNWVLTFYLFNIFLKDFISERMLFILKIMLFILRSNILLLKLLQRILSLCFVLFEILNISLNHLFFCSQKFSWLCQNIALWIIWYFYCVKALIDYPIINSWKDLEFDTIFWKILEDSWN